jgi:hypothetical protein
VAIARGAIGLTLFDQACLLRLRCGWPPSWACHPSGLLVISGVAKQQPLVVFLAWPRNQIRTFSEDSHGSAEGEAGAELDRTTS